MIFCVAPLVLTIILLASCNQQSVPRPHGYFRIDMPGKSYLNHTSDCPFSFEYPEYARIIPDTSDLAEPCWFHIDFPVFSGRIHMSYKPVKNNLATFLDDTRRLVNKHIPKANAIRESVYSNPDAGVYGTVFHISGAGAASPVQFFLTDSLHHFIRGALYFNTIPNNDSLAPVIQFIDQDIERMINTFRWK